MFDGAPDQLQAIVVGVDDYAACEAWNLNGPTRDALNTVDWLCAQGVPTQNIALFLSPKSRNTQLVQRWLASKPGLDPQDATSQGFARFVNDDMQGNIATSLLLHWGGHGVVGNEADEQFLYTADATKSVPHCVCVGSGANHG